MLTRWITAYVLGVCAARCGLVAAWGALIPLGAAVVWRQGRREQGRRLLVQVLVATLAWSWGWRHAAPALCDDVAGAQFVASNGPYPAGGPILVATPQGLVEAYGPQTDAVLGQLRARPGPRLFAPCYPAFRAATMARAAASGLLALTAARLRMVLMKHSNAFEPDARAWLRSIVLGDKSRLARGVSDVFRQTGLYHLLVVSGQHVTLIAMVLSLILRAPLLGLYALRLINPRSWPAVAAVLALLAGLLGWVYAACTGMSAAAQRAAILFAVWQATRVFCGVLPVGTRLRFAFTLQSLLFPIGLLSEASVMSWAAYLIVLANRPPRRPSWRQGLRHVAGLQVRMMIVVAACFGQLSLIGLVANGVFVSFFSLLLVQGLALLAWPQVPGARLWLGMQRTFVGLLGRLGGLCERLPWLALTPQELPPALRLALAVAAVTILLNTCRDLSISSYEST